MTWSGNIEGQVRAEFATARRLSRGVIAKASDERAPVKIGKRDVPKARDVRRIVVGRGVVREEWSMPEANETRLRTSEQAAYDQGRLDERHDAVAALTLLLQHRKEGEDARMALERILHERAVLAGVAIDAWTNGRSALARVVRERNGTRVVVVAKRV